MNQCYLCEFKSNKKSDPKGVGVFLFLTPVELQVYASGTKRNGHATYYV